MSGVLRVDPSVRTDRDGCVARADGELEKDLLLNDPALSDGVEVAVFAVRVDRPTVVDRRRVHAPLETVRLVIDAGHLPVRSAAAGLRVRVPELPLLLQIRAELRDEVGLGSGVEILF